MKPTVREIARKANVSIASVSMVLSDKPSRITETTKRRIIEAARDLGYDLEAKAWGNAPAAVCRGFFPGRDV